MIKEKKVDVLVCDVCGEEIPGGGFSGKCALCSKDLCFKCKVSVTFCNIQTSFLEVVDICRSRLPKELMDKLEEKVK